MLHTGQNLPFGRGITGQFVRDDHARHVFQTLKQLAEEAFGRLLVAPALHQDVEYISVLIHRSPEVVPLAVDGEKDLVQMPLVTTARATTAHRFVGQSDASLGHQLFDVTIAEGETIIEPDTVTNDLGRKAIPFVGGGRSVCFHAASMSH